MQLDVAPLTQIRSRKERGGGRRVEGEGGG